MADENTVSVEAGSTLVHGNLTQFVGFPGDTFNAGGMSVPVASIDSTSQMTLAYGWPDVDVISSTAWSLQRTSTEWSSAVQIHKSVATLVQRMEGGLPLSVNAAGTPAGRALHDGAPEGFSYVEATTDPDDPFLLSFKLSDATADWSARKAVVGARGLPGPGNTLTIGVVNTVSPDAPADARLAGVSPSQVLSLDIPKGDTGDVTPEALAARDDARDFAANASTDRGASELAASQAITAAANAALFDPTVRFSTVPALLASTRGAAGQGSVWQAGNHQLYVEAAPSATDQHVTTSGGVKLYVVPDGGAVDLAALGVDDTGVTNVSATVQKLIGYAREILLPAGTFYAGVNATSPVTLTGAGEGRTILTTAALTNGTTISVNANLVLRDMTVKCHPTNASSKTINHSGAHRVIANHVTFEGANHSPAVHLEGMAGYRDCTFLSGNQPNSLGALCHSPGADFWNCLFRGGRTIEAKDSKFYDCIVRATDNAVHIPDGDRGNDGILTGFSGISEWYGCDIQSEGTGMTCGNGGHPKLRRTDILAGTVMTGVQAFYARSASTLDAEDCTFTAQNNGVGVSFSGLQGPGNIARAGNSIMTRCRLEGVFNALAVPATSSGYPAAIGNLLLVDCSVIGGESKISPNTSTYHIFRTEKPLNLTSAVTFENNGETKRFRFKGDGQIVTVSGSDGAKSGCHLSHLDAVTGQPHPDGMSIALRYNGVSSRFVTFATGTTGDSGTMYFADNASTLATTQWGAFSFRLVGTSWRQMDG